MADWLASDPGRFSECEGSWARLSVLSKTALCWTQQGRGRTHEDNMHPAPSVSWKRVRGRACSAPQDSGFPGRNVELPPIPISGTLPISIFLLKPALAHLTTVFLFADTLSIYPSFCSNTPYSNATSKGWELGIAFQWEIPECLSFYVQRCDLGKCLSRSEFPAV